MLHFYVMVNKPEKVKTNKIYVDISVCSSVTFTSFFFASFLPGDVTTGPDLIDDDRVVGLGLRQGEPEDADPDQDRATHIHHTPQTFEKKALLKMVRIMKLHQIV